MSDMLHILLPVSSTRLIGAIQVFNCILRGLVFVYLGISESRNADGISSYALWTTDFSSLASLRLFGLF